MATILNFTNCGNTVPFTASHTAENAFENVVWEMAAILSWGIWFVVLLSVSGLSNAWVNHNAEFCIFKSNENFFCNITQNAQHFIECIAIWCPYKYFQSVFQTEYSSPMTSSVWLEAQLTPSPYHCCKYYNVIHIIMLNYCLEFWRLLNVNHFPFQYLLVLWSTGSICFTFWPNSWNKCC